MRVAIDAMGGDSAPGEVVKGAVAAAQQNPKLNVLLVGRRDKIEPELTGSVPENLSVEHAETVIETGESAIEALRRKPDSSIARCVGLIREGKAEAMVSAGSTSAVVASATIGLNLLEGVKRAGIAVPMPTQKGFSAMIDVGANINSRWIHLVQYAVMGSLWVRLRDASRPKPTVGLLNVGAEHSKGSETIRDAYEALERSSLNFIGNIEGHDVYTGKADVIVCDGFVGNITLKSGEGLAAKILKKMSEAVGSIPEAREAIDLIARGTGFATEGGAPLMGVRGIVIICHGRSGCEAIKNAALTAARFVENRLNDHIIEELARLALEGARS